MFFRKNKSAANKFKSKISEEDFVKGIKFKAKFIGSMDIERPDSRVEIVSAMRRTRESFKMNKCKKYVVEMDISVDGVKTLLHRKKKKNNCLFDVEILTHSISRIYYVSHDSRDLKIFSYISSDHSSQLFKCNVFKSFNKKTAVQIVKTIGLSFDVCHAYENENVISTSCSQQIQREYEADKPRISTPNSTINIKNYEIQRKKNEILNISLPEEETSRNDLFKMHETQYHYLKKQVQLLEDHLNTEIQSRINAQLQSKQLLEQNEILLKQLSNVINCFSSLKSRKLYLHNEMEYKNKLTSHLLRSYSTNKTLQLENDRNSTNNQSPVSPTTVIQPHHQPSDNVLQPQHFKLSDNTLQQQQQSPDSGHDEQLSDLVQVKLFKSDSWESNLSAASSNFAFSATDVEQDDNKRNSDNYFSGNQSSVYMNDFYDQLCSFDDVASFKYLNFSKTIIDDSSGDIINEHDKNVCYFSNIESDALKVGESPARTAELTIITPVRHNSKFSEQFCIRSEHRNAPFDDSNYIYDGNLKYSYSEGCLVTT